MRDALRQGFATATDLADYLTRKGLPSVMRTQRSAWQCATPRNRAFNLAALSLADLQGFSPLVADDVFTVLTVENGSLTARNHVGGTAPEQVLAAIARARRT